MSEGKIYLMSCGCGFIDGRTDRQKWACENHLYAWSLATPSPVVMPSNTTLLAKLRDEVEAEIDYFCQVMHITYETAAIEEGWRTQEITRGEWENSPESNKATMRKSVRAVLLALLEKAGE